MSVEPISNYSSSYYNYFQFNSSSFQPNANRLPNAILRTERAFAEGSSPYQSVETFPSRTRIFRNITQDVNDIMRKNRFGIFMDTTELPIVIVYIIESYIYSYSNDLPTLLRKKEMKLTFDESQAIQTTFTASQLALSYFSSKE